MNVPNQNDSVKAWKETLILPTYPSLAPDPNPMFYEHRNIQGAKGNIYPVPMTDQLSSDRVDRPYQAIYLENEFIQLIMLPEIGGRIFAGLDKTNNYDFFYRHRVIKPALIGVYGPWISGGVEFNWPQHHRPTTFSPVDSTIESHVDGSVTVWLSEHDPFNRTKGMVGVCLYPGKAIVETKVRLFNRTSVPHTFLWWENVGVHINEKYQVIFPPDVHWAVFHTKAIVTPFPMAKGIFNNGIDFGEGTDVSWYVNAPQPTSFFAGDSKYEFFGGYDHSREAGVVHVANRHISPGKKFFTWGNGPFGHRWQDNLMDDEGEYLELMAGVYTDNQPDFTWIMPYETKTFSQYWVPVQKTGAMKNANIHMAVNLEIKNPQDGAKNASIRVYATEHFSNAQILLTTGGDTLYKQVVDLAPGKPFSADVPLKETVDEYSLILRVLTARSNEIIRYQVEKPWDGKLPEPFQPPATPTEISSVEQLYLAGLHLEQYRHPFVSPLPYWQEALRRDPGDSRTHIALGRLALRQGDLDKAEEHMRAAVKRTMSWNFNPYDGEALYYLGVILQAKDQVDEAYDTFYKATWNQAWQAASFYRLGLLDSERGDFVGALEHFDQSLKLNFENCKSRGMKSAMLRHLDRYDEAEVLAQETLSMDPLDLFARHELVLIARETGKPRVTQQRLDELHDYMRGEVQTYLDVSFDYASAGLWEDTGPLLGYMANGPDLYPMVAYTLGSFSARTGREDLAKEWYQKGAAASPDYCFPWRLEELHVLEEVLKVYPDDSRAHYYLGNLLYDKKQYEKAIEHWKEATRLEPGLAIPWRNLALAAYNLDHNLDMALENIHQAFTANPKDPRILLEYDQLLYRKACSASERLDLLESHMDVVERRDDLVSQRVMLLNCSGQPEKALEISLQRSFHPWEGGEGSVAEHYANAHWLIGKKALQAGNPGKALDHFQQGLVFPDSLGEIPLDGEVVHIIYSCGLAFEALGKKEEARQAFEKILTLKGELSPVIYFQGLALQHLEKPKEAQTVLKDLLERAEKYSQNPPGTNYFYYGNPSPVFEDDPVKLQKIYFTFLAGLARLGLGDRIGARSALGQVLAVDPTRLIAYEEFKNL